MHYFEELRLTGKVTASEQVQWSPLNPFVVHPHPRPHPHPHPHPHAATLPISTHKSYLVTEAQERDALEVARKEARVSMYVERV